jgi:hypothetical protein
MKVMKNNVASDEYGINGRVVATSITNEKIENAMTKEKQHMVSQSLNYLSLYRGHPLLIQCDEYVVIQACGPNFFSFINFLLQATRECL